MNRTNLSPSGSPKAVGPYSQAVRVGQVLLSSGQIPLDPLTGALVQGDIRAQTRQVFQNLKAILEGENLGWNDVVKTTVFMTNLAEFGAMNEVYASFFTEQFPARSTVQVAGLPKGASIEIEMVAVYPPNPGTC